MINQWGTCPESLKYIASVENRPKGFSKFSLNFDFKKCQIVGAITQITTLYLKTNPVSNGTFIHNIIKLEITLS